MVLDGAYEQLDRLLGGMDAHLLETLVDVPNGGDVAGRLALGYVALDPAYEARLMLPEEERVSQHAPGLDPDDLLVDEQAGLCPSLLDESLPAVSVPLVDRRVGHEMRQTPLTGT